MAASALRKLWLTLEMIRFEHSIFALPFALTGGLLAWRELGFPMAGLGWKVLWIIVCMVSARAAAIINESIRIPTHLSLSPSEVRF